MVSPRRETGRTWISSDEMQRFKRLFGAKLGSVLQIRKMRSVLLKRQREHSDIDISVKEFDRIIKILGYELKEFMSPEVLQNYENERFREETERLKVPRFDFKQLRGEAVVQNRN